MSLIGDAQLANIRKFCRHVNMQHKSATQRLPPKVPAARPIKKMHFPTLHPKMPFFYTLQAIVRAAMPCRVTQLPTVRAAMACRVTQLIIVCGAMACRVTREAITCGTMPFRVPQLLFCISMQAAAEKFAFA